MPVANGAAVDLNTHPFRPLPDRRLSDSPCPAVRVACDDRSTELRDIVTADGRKLPATRPPRPRPRPLSADTSPARRQRSEQCTLP